ncbi:hypothetical protein [Pseudothauera rhizosphaerae]|uniref:Uncharacterized protein n=1 Tax=Pseudothauera rhizosphaerae TaxID=2565932 RepID=A0A4S4AWD6_9RHOO|nr:hypothetical protein [Pseudothauera rhizosphaerae]THF64339.1 hypothetical protein E6O51_03240 [Pseudothauera rhizosphaerae]
MFVTLADAPEARQWPDSFPDVVVRPTAAALRLDWRALVGCAVVLIADERTDLLRRLAEKLCALANSVMVSIISELQDGPGFMWVRGAGWRRV